MPKTNFCHSFNSFLDFTKSWGAFCAIKRNCIVYGTVHKVHHAIFGQFRPPYPCHTLSHIPGPPKVRHTSRPPPFLVGLVQKDRTKTLCTNSFSIAPAV